MITAFATGLIWGIFWRLTSPYSNGDPWHWFFLLLGAVILTLLEWIVGII